MVSVSITCPRCGKTSFNLGDIENRYCGYCHAFHDDGMTSRLSEDQIALPKQLPVPKDAITFWVIWDHPVDYPQGYLLRAQFVIHGKRFVSKIAWHADDPEKLRAILPPGGWRFERRPGDPKHLLETWMQ